MRCVIRHLLLSVAAVTALYIASAGTISAQGLPADPEASFKRDYPAVTFEAIEKTGIKGLYEVFAGGNLFYYHPKTGNLLFGEMITRDFRNITAERRNERIAAVLKTLPLDKAIRIGTGRNVVIEFTDVDCPFCRKLEDLFEKRDDVSRYVFLFPLTQIHPDSLKKSLAVLCSQDRAQAYKNAAAGRFDGKDMPGCGDAAARLLDEHQEIGKRLGIQGTPALWVNSTPVGGANAVQIERLLDAGNEAHSLRKEVKP
jgi:thiol:disulfide interchange protein DsbC